MHEVCSLLHVCGNERQILLQLRVSLTGWPDYVLEKPVSGFLYVSIKDDGAERHQRAFRDIKAQPVLRLDRIMHVHFYVSVLAVENFQKKRQIVRARRAQSIIVDRCDLLF